ncbi:MAG: CHASE2 domain-containing protein [Bacteroidaceae bacterium]|nr:CHASE2 domain-containing protein [Bacteroidaceae bacterium]
MEKNSGVNGRKERNKERTSTLLRHICVTFLAVAIVGIFAFVTVKAKPLDPLKRTIEEFSFTDIYYEIQGEDNPDSSMVITIVDMTNVIKRADIAQTLADIEKQHPKVIGVDCLFESIGEDLEGNEAIIDAASTYKNIVFAEAMTDWENDSVGWSNAKRSFFAELTDITEGTINFKRTLYDSMKRKAPVSETYQGKQVPSFVTQLANLYADSTIVTADSSSDININFSKTHFHVLQPKEIASHPELIEDRIVLFGAMNSVNDLHWTPLGKISGTELQAYALQSIILSKEIHDLQFVPFCIISLLIIFFVQVLQSLYIKRTRSSSNLFVKHVVGSTYILNILTFLFTSVFIGISFFVFAIFNISINLGWALSAIAFLETSRSLYASIKEYINSKRDKYKFLKGVRL